MNTVDVFRQLIERAGLVPPSVIPLGKLIRFPGIGKSNGNKSAWAWVSEDGQGGAYGDWASGLSDTWHAQHEHTMTAVERAAHKHRVAELQRIRQEEEARQHTDAAQHAQAIWDRATSGTVDHPYLRKKAVQAHGLRVGRDNRLIIPVMINRTLVSLQFIDANGRKQFLPGGKVKGGTFTIGELSNVDTLLLCEGFATAASLYEATALPTIMSFSANNLQPVAEQLRRQYPATTILVCGDNDIRDDGTPNTGWDAATAAAKAIEGLLAIPELDGTKCDWNDVHVHRGLEAVTAAIEAAIRGAQDWTPDMLDDAAPAPTVLAEPIRLTDVGNATRFAQHHHDHIRYCYPLKAWFVRNEASLWERDPGNRVTQLAKDTVRRLYDDAGRESNDERRAKLSAHAVKSENAQRLQAMLDLARSEPGIAISPEAFDTDPWLFSVVDGVLDLRTGACRARQPGDFISKQSRTRFDPAAACPTWLRFLTRIFQDDQRLITYIQQMTGYCLTGLTVEQVFFLLWGSGANGKSTLLKVLLALFGDYGLQVPADTFLSRTQDGRATPDLARLQGARLAVAIESDEGCRLAEGTLKQMTGGDRIAARRLYQDFVEFEPTHKILFSTNHKPRVRDNTHAMWRRMRLIPFAVQIPDDEQDPTLADKLLVELPGILNWAVAGCLAWQHAGRLQAPEPVVTATASYRTEQDVLDDFLRERCVRGTDHCAKFAELRQQYAEWAKEVSERPLSSKAFAAALQERGFRPILVRNARQYAGLRLRTIDDELADAQSSQEEAQAHEPVQTEFIVEAADVVDR